MSSPKTTRSYRLGNPIERAGGRSYIKWEMSSDYNENLITSKQTSDQIMGSAGFDLSLTNKIQVGGQSLHIYDGCGDQSAKLTKKFTGNYKKLTQ